MNDAWHTAWVEALDDLEGTLADTEKLLRGGAEPEPETTVLAGTAAGAAWTPPEMPCPLPSDLVQRAENLLARQRLLVTEAAAAVGGLRQQASLVQRMESRSGMRPAHRPVYVDLTA